MSHSVIAIGASHASGPGGLRDDLVTIARLGVEPVSVCTAVSASSLNGKPGIHPLPSTLVADQLNEILAMTDDSCVIKTGHVCDAEAIDLLTDALEELALGRFPIVSEAILLDPLGQPLLDDFALATLKRRLLLIPDLLVCTRADAEALTGLPAVDDYSTLHAAEMLLTIGPRNVFIEGGREGPDILVTESGEHGMYGGIEDMPVLPGYTTAAAIATFLSAGYQMDDAVKAARDVVRGQFAPPLLAQRQGDAAAMW